MTPALKRLEGDRKRIAKCTGREGEERGAGEGAGGWRERWREGGRKAHWQRMRGAEGGGGVWLRRRSERD